MKRDATSPERGDSTRPRMPTWVKVFAIVGLILFIAVLILHLTGNSLGNHGIDK